MDDHPHCGGAYTFIAKHLLSPSWYIRSTTKKGKLVGKPLALIDALFYPLLVLDGLLIAFLFVIFANIPDGNLALSESLTLLSYILVIIVDLIICVIAWHKIR